MENSDDMTLDLLLQKNPSAMRAHIKRLEATAATTAAPAPVTPLAPPPRADPTKVAYLVLPTYDWTQLGSASKRPDPGVVRTLEACGLLPDSLESYGRAEDLGAFRRVLEARGFTVHPAAGSSVRVDLHGFKATLEQLVDRCSSPDDVLVLAYCGHGHQELYTRHASLVLSDNRHVSSIYLDRVLSRSKGTVYTVLNCCNADADTLTHGEGMLCLAAHRRVDILSSSSTERQKASKGGTAFVRAFEAVLGGNPERRVPLSQLQQRLRDAVAEEGPLPGTVGTVLVLLHSLEGDSLGPAAEESKVSMFPQPPGQLFYDGDYPL
jgi:hypothetical protein